MAPRARGAASSMGSRVFTQSEAVAGFGAGAAAYWANDATNPNFGQPDFAPGKVYENERELAGRKPLSYETGLTVSGGSHATRYFVGGLGENDGGVITNTGVKGPWRRVSGVHGAVDGGSTERHNLRLLGQGGVDWFGQKTALVFPPELQFEPLDGEPGTSLLTNGDNLNDNWNVNLVHTYRPGRFAATTAVGMQEEDQDLGISRIISKNLVPNQANVNSGADVSVDQRLEKVHDFGFYGQEELLALDERLLLTAGVRADRSSNNGDQQDRKSTRLNSSHSQISYAVFC